MVKTSMNMEENVASALCYVLMWLTGIIFYFMEKENKTVKFHAMQSILTFLPLQIIAAIVGWIGAPKWNPSGGFYGFGTWDPGIPALVWLSWLIYLVMFVLWVIFIFKAYQGAKFKLPVIGDIAEKHVK
jgi:uncharacterized membrane protein